MNNTPRENRLYPVFCLLQYQCIKFPVMQIIIKFVVAVIVVVGLKQKIHFHINNQSAINFTKVNGMLGEHSKSL